MSQRATTPQLADTAVDYEAPRVERVLSPTELEREVLYAGTEPVSAADGAEGN